MIASGTADAATRAEYDALRAELDPFLVRLPRNREPGRYPVMDATAPYGERLADMIRDPHQIGIERVKGLHDAIGPVFVSVIDEDVRAFNNLTLDATLVALGAGPFSEAASRTMTIGRLFGQLVGRDVADEAWLRGYLACLARLVLEGEIRGIAFPNPTTDLRLVEERAKALAAMPPETWLDVGNQPPITGALINDALSWIVDEYFRRLAPIFMTKRQEAARTQLLAIALKGYAIGRAQLEQSVIEAIPISAAPTATPGMSKPAGSGIDVAAEAIEVVAMALELRPPEKLQKKRLRMVFQAGREKALRQAYVLGVRAGVLDAQRDLAADPSRLGWWEETLNAGEPAPIPAVGSLPFQSSDYADRSEYFAACERYGQGYGLGYTLLVEVRLGRRGT
jgi:hypothetical protein